MVKTVFPGWVDKRRLYVAIRLINGNLTITGTLGTRSVTACGQIHDCLKELTRFSKGWDRHLADDLFEVWRTYHLNNLRAGCVHQRDMGWLDRKDEADLPAGWKLYHPGGDGLLGRACPVCGYEYGSQWLTHKLPEGLEKFLESLPVTADVPRWV